MSINSITPKELLEIRKRGQDLVLIDVRTPIEYQEVHVENAKNFPLSDLDPKALINKQNGSKHDQVYVICRSGARGLQACEKLISYGLSNVCNVEGGTMACIDAGFPVVRGKAAISLERQVRIAAGTLVLLGAILAWIVNPAFIGLSAFVGAGLIFAGISDTCGMAMVLARMPWNNCNNSASSCCPGNKN